MCSCRDCPPLPACAPASRAARPDPAVCHGAPSATPLCLGQSPARLDPGPRAPAPLRGRGVSRLGQVCLLGGRWEPACTFPRRSLSPGDPGLEGVEASPAQQRMWWGASPRGPAAAGAVSGARAPQWQGGPGGPGLPTWAPAHSGLLQQRQAEGSCIDRRGPHSPCSSEPRWASVLSFPPSGQVGPTAGPPVAAVRAEPAPPPTVTSWSPSSLPRTLGEGTTWSRGGQGPTSMESQ